MSWKVYKFNYQTETAFKIVDEKLGTVGVIVGQHHIEGDVKKAEKKANLIAAAPDMLEVLEVLSRI